MKSRLFGGIKWGPQTLHKSNFFKKRSQKKAKKKGKLKVDILKKLKAFFRIFRRI